MNKLLQFLPGVFLFVLLVTISLPAAAASQVKAFPTAEGYGKNTVGGRGGEVIEVTNLNDSGAGSLRACIEAKGPRVCVFKVAGTIEVDSALAIRNPYITIAGQTAPGDGIAIKNRSSLRSPVEIWADEVILRHFRVRSGPTVQTSDLNDAVSINAAVNNVILDHMSLSWSTDEMFSGTGTNVTLQWSMLYEGLDKSTHQRPHSKGVFAVDATSASFSMYNNLVAHFGDRTPNIDLVGPAEVVNNLFYNSRDKFGEFYDHAGQTSLNYVGNMVVVGPSTPKTMAMYPMDAGSQINPETRDLRIYLKDNVSVQRPSNTGDDRLVLAPEDWHLARTSLVQPLQVSAVSAPQQAARDILAFAGATKPNRDSADARVVNEVRTCKGKIVNSPSEVGGWPNLSSGTVAKDTDKDGMSDSWEVANGFNSSVSDGASDKDGDGYTNLEEYLNELAGDGTSKIGTGTGVIPDADCGYSITKVANPKPYIDIGLSLGNVNPGENTVLTWSTAHATACTASGDWSGAKPLNGYQVFTPTSPKTFTLTCTGPGGTTVSFPRRSL
jgi:pectate lyase